MILRVDARSATAQKNKSHGVTSARISRQSSNKRPNTVWITFGLHVVVRIHAHNLAASFPAAFRRYESQ